MRLHRLSIEMLVSLCPLRPESFVGVSAENEVNTDVVVVVVWWWVKKENDSNQMSVLYVILHL